MTATFKNTTALTRLIQFIFVAMLVFTGLTTTGCGLVDSNAPDEIERVITLEPETDVSLAVVAREENDLDPIGDGNPFEFDDNDPLKRLFSTIEQQPLDPAKEPEVDLSASLVKETFRTITVQIAARANDSNLYYVLRQHEGQAPVLLRYFNGSALFNGSSLPPMTDTLTKGNADRMVEYFIVDDGGTVVSTRFPFKVPRTQALP